MRRPGRAGFFLWVRALSCSEMTERRVPAAGTGRSVEPGALKIEPVVPTRPNLQACGLWTFDHQRRGPPEAGLAALLLPVARPPVTGGPGHSSEGVVRDVVALFLGRGELPPVQQTGLHTDQRSTDSSNRRTRTWPILFLFRSGDGHR